MKYQVRKVYSQFTLRWFYELYKEVRSYWFFKKWVKIDNEADPSCLDRWRKQYGAFDVIDYEQLERTTDEQEKGD